MAINDEFQEKKQKVLDEYIKIREREKKVTNKKIDDEDEFVSNYFLGMCYSNSETRSQCST